MRLDHFFFSLFSGRESSCNQLHPTSFKDILSEDKGFYNQPNYLDATSQDFAQKNLLPVNYTWNTESKTMRISKQILSIIIFPIVIHRLLHALAGKIALLPSSSPGLMGYSANQIDNMRSKVPLGGEWKYKRITVEVDGYKVDATIMGKASTLNNGRWVLASNGNGEFYENKLHNHDFKQILSEVDGNAIVFNYPGVGASSGLPNREAMAKAYCAMLNLLENQEKGMGAKEIIGYGFSIGGGVQGDALKNFKLKEDVKYVFVKDRTFSDLKTTASILTIKPLGFLVKILGWNMSSVESSKKLQVPEIIMQTSKVKGYEELNDSSKIIDDGVIAADASLAKALLKDDKCPKKNKIFIGMQEEHCERLNNISFLTEKIKEMLKK